VQPPVQFVTPEHLREEVDEAIGSLPSGELFLNPKLQHLRDKWAASRFGIGYQHFIAPCYLALNTSETRKDVDFFLRVHEQVFCFQTAETIEPGRKRSDEYRVLRREGRYSTLVDPEEGREFGPAWIADTVRRKVGKNYAEPSDLELLIYANFTGRNLEFAACREACSEFRGAFGSIWVVADYFIGSLYGRSDLGELLGWGKFFERA
jgi:hypothetical protein